jgi:hypothetical protein
MKVKLLCKDCGEEIFANINMVMLKDRLWKKICDKMEDAYCDCCIEIRMGKAITKRDLMQSSFIPGQKYVLCNEFWLMNKNEK